MEHSGERLEGGADGSRLRIGHTDERAYEVIDAVHGGARRIRFQRTLTGDPDLDTFLFVDRAVIPSQSGVGHHRHRLVDEMFCVLNDCRAQFTVDGVSAILDGPVCVPCHAGSSHAIYNPFMTSIEFLNIAVGSLPGAYDAEDFGEDMAGTAVVPTPPFRHASFGRREDRSQLDVEVDGVVRRRLFGAAAFANGWSSVEYVRVRSGAVLDLDRKRPGSCVVYVLAGLGELTASESLTHLPGGAALQVRMPGAATLESISSDSLDLLLIALDPGLERTHG
jgi:mannose-6-phosphate isomerase-like protein (cupin superfamily)